MDACRTLLALPALLLAAAPACAGIYKWVDENGVVNYSATLPSRSGIAVRALEPAGSRLSVYSPVTKPGDMRARRDPATDTLRSRVEQLEEQLAAERRQRVHATQIADDRHRHEYEDCVRSRAVDCNPDRPSMTASTLYPVVVVRRPVTLIPTLPVTPRPAPAPAAGPGWGKPSTMRWR